MIDSKNGRCAAMCLGNQQNCRTPPKGGKTALEFSAKRFRFGSSLPAHPLFSNLYGDNVLSHILNIFSVQPKKLIPSPPPQRRFPLSNEGLFCPLDTSHPSRVSWNQGCFFP